MTEFTAIQIPGADRRPLEIDVFSPSGENTGVGVILLHGGGWAHGHRSFMHGYARELAAHGITGIAAEYRLLPESPWPGQIEDVRDVVRWAKTEGVRFGVDPSKVALQGYSAGGHLALLVAGTQPGSPFQDRLGGSVAGTEIAAVVAFFAPTRFDLAPERLKQPPLSQLLPNGTMEDARSVSPLHYVHPGFPTTFVLGGMSDFAQPFDAALPMVQALLQAGVETEFHYLHSQTHEFSGMPGMLRGVMDEVAFFYQRTLLEREALAAEARSLNIFARASSREELMQVLAAESAKAAAKS